MNQLKKYLIYIVLIVILVFGWGLGTWLLARLYQPQEPVQAPLQPYKFPPKDVSYSLSRFEPLMNGRLFFGGPVNGGLQINFSSRLVLWGVIKGETAVVGQDQTSNKDTSIVHVGGYVAGEQIVGIGSNYIIVRNSSGEGKVSMAGE